MFFKKIKISGEAGRGERQGEGLKKGALFEFPQKLADISHRHRLFD